MNKNEQAAYNNEFNDGLAGKAYQEWHDENALTSWAEVTTIDGKVTVQAKLL